MYILKSETALFVETVDYFQNSTWRICTLKSAAKTEGQVFPKIVFSFLEQGLESTNFTCKHALRKCAVLMLTRCF